jgi:sugar phosphate isomerase/epimerase
MNNEEFVGWGREDDERHHRLLRNDLKFKRYNGTIMHLEHPEQQELIQTGKSNLDLLKKITNDNSNFNEI